MKRIPTILPRKEQSNNATFTLPIKVKNKALLKYLNSPVFERDFERAMEEKEAR